MPSRDNTTGTTEAGAEYDLSQLRPSDQMMGELNPYIEGLSTKTALDMTDVLFSGLKRSSLDDKGRLFIPKIVQEGNPEGRYAILRTAQNCLWLTTMREYRRIATDLLQATRLSRSAQEIKSVFFYHSQSNIVPDGSGRVTISKPRIP